MGEFTGSVVTANGITVAVNVGINLRESFIITDEIFDPTQQYVLHGPDGWHVTVMFLGQTFIRQLKPVHFRRTHC